MRLRSIASPGRLIAGPLVFVSLMLIFQALGSSCNATKTATTTVAAKDNKTEKAPAVTTPAATTPAVTTPAAEATEPPTLQFNTPTEKKAYRAKKLNMKALRRLDCRLEGSSCAACLNSIKKTVDKLNGVYEIAVMLKKPYGMAVIYDSTKLKLDKIMDTAKKDKKATEVKFLEPQDKPIDTPPAILIPSYNELVK